MISMFSSTRQRLDTGKQLTNRSWYIATSITVLACAWHTALAQSAGQRHSCDLMTLSPNTRPIQMHESLASALRKSAECLARDDSGCADELLSQVDATSFNDDEKALFMSARAQVADSKGDQKAALKLFRTALEDSNAGRDAKAIVAQTYATSLLNQGRPKAALRVLDAGFDCETWTAQALVTRAAAYELTSASEIAMANLDAAIRLYEVAGRETPAKVVSMRSQIADSLALKEGKERPIDDASAPAATTRVAPDYPSLALANGIPGCVRLAFSISESGTVENARVVRSSNKVFNRAALETIQKWRYAPQLENGVPVRRDDVTSTMVWSLEGGRKPPEC